MVEDDLIHIQVEKEITALFKYYLEMLEQIEPDPTKYAELRKRVLSHSNDTIRQLQAFLGFFDFQVNKERVQEAAKNSVTHKKTIIGSFIRIE